MKTEMKKERCTDCKKEKDIKEFLVGNGKGQLVSIRCNNCREKLI